MRFYVRWLKVATVGSCKCCSWSFELTTMAGLWKCELKNIAFERTDERCVPFVNIQILKNEATDSPRHKHKLFAFTFQIDFLVFIQHSHFLASGFLHFGKSNEPCGQTLIHLLYYQMFMWEVVRLRARNQSIDQSIGIITRIRLISIYKENLLKKKVFYKNTSSNCAEEQSAVKLINRKIGNNKWKFHKKTNN